MFTGKCSILTPIPLTKPIDVLKKGIKALRKQIDSWKLKIQADLDAHAVHRRALQ